MYGSVVQVMSRHDAALVIAGLLGSGGAVVHGLLTQWRIVDPLQALAAGRISTLVQRLVPLLLQFTTFHWFAGGLALIVAAQAPGPDAKLAVGLLVGSSYLFAAAGNAWASHGRHPGWLIYGTAFVLIVYGLWEPGM